MPSLHRVWRVLKWSRAQFMNLFGELPREKLLPLADTAYRELVH